MVFFLLVTTSSFVYSSEVNFYSPNYFTQSDNEVDPLRFLEYEPLTFEVCPEQNVNGQMSDVSAQIVCSSGSSEVDIELNQYSTNGCYYGNLEEITCEGDLEISYTQDSKDFLYSKELLSTKESSVVDRVLSQDFESISNPLDLSYYLVVHNKIKGMNAKSNEIYEKLRDMRDNDEKCWTDNSCDIKDTTQILYNLKLAGYDDSNRLIQDGEIYLNSQIINTTLESATFRTQLNMKSSFNGSFECEVFTDDSDDSDRTITVDQSKNISSRSFSSSFEIDCNNNEVDEMIFTIETSEEKFNITEEDSDNFKYDRDDVAFCFGEDSSCDRFSTLYALATYEQDLEYYSELVNYIENFKYSSSVNREYILEDDDVTLTALYSKIVQDDATENFLKFSQNNDGSWGGGNENKRIFETYWGIESMRELNAQSYIEDAENWMYFEEPRNGWGNTQRNSLAYLSIERFIRPFLTIDYNQVLDEISTITLFNPSIFEIENIEIEVDDEIEQYISFPKNLRTIEADDEIEFEIETQSSILTDKKGMIKVSGIANDNSREEFISVPLIIKAPELISFSSNTSQFSKDEPIIEVEVTHNEPDIELSCEYTNSFTNKNRDITLNREVNILTISNTDFQTGEMEVQLTCRRDDDVIEITGFVDVQEQDPTFTVESETMQGEELLIDDFNSAQLVVNSIVEDEQEISLQFENTFLGLVEISNPSFFIREDGRRIIQFSADDVSMLESFQNTTDSILISSDSGYAERVDIRYMHNVSMSWTLIIGIVAGVIVFIIIVLVTLRVINTLRNQNQANNSQAQEFDDDDTVDLDDFDFN